LLLAASDASPGNSLASGSPLSLLRSSASNLAYTNRTAGTLRSIAASFVKTASGDIDDTQDMKGAPHSHCCQIAASRRTGWPGFGGPVIKAEPWLGLCPFWRRFSGHELLMAGEERVLSSA